MDFFTKYVYGHEPFDDAEALAKAGLQLAKAGERQAWIGQLNFVPNQNQLVVARGTIRNTPLYNIM
ncbi:MAG: hypothetical protein ICV53_09670 [Flavisolibacter sp.]|nr:hypothetical protein [Flavisolibacter sp.]MBD0366355.1 hypothetical protein [Flavisolibacter sp.]